MLVERGLQVMNVNIVGEAYDIAANYLRRSGDMPDPNAVNETLLEIVVQKFYAGDRNKIRLANHAIARFLAAPGR